jgi:hypothetical protein
VIGLSATFDAIKVTAKLGDGGLKADWHKLRANILVGSVMVGGAVWACLRKDRAAGCAAIGAAQTFRPLVALGHLPSMPHPQIQNRPLKANATVRSMIAGGVWPEPEIAIPRSQSSCTRRAKSHGTVNALAGYPAVPSPTALQHNDGLSVAPARWGRFDSLVFLVSSG